MTFLQQLRAQELLHDCLGKGESKQWLYDQFTTSGIDPDTPYIRGMIAGIELSGHVGYRAPDGTVILGYAAAEILSAKFASVLNARSYYDPDACAKVLLTAKGHYWRDWTCPKMI